MKLENFLNLNCEKYERNDMPNEVRQKKYRKIKQDPKMLNFGASKPGVERSLNLRLKKDTMTVLINNFLSRLKMESCFS